MEKEYLLSEKLYKILKAKGLKVATAESCTGGLIGASLTSVPGMSECYGYGVVTYANSAKEELLGVMGDTLKTKGAVSPDTACQMAEGVLKISNADIAVSVTGIAGPGGGTKDKPVGLVYIGIAKKGEDTKAYKNIFSGDREQVRRSTVSKALELVIENID
jgi:PncC family amidohydrolase